MDIDSGSDEDLPRGSGPSRRRANIGWSKPNAEKELFTPLIQVAYNEQMHLLKFNEITTRWKEFACYVFKEIEPFKSMTGSISSKALRHQYNERIKTFRASPPKDEANLTEIEKTLRLIVDEADEESAKKVLVKSAAELKRKEMESAESAVLCHQQVSEDAAAASKKRLKLQDELKVRDNQAGSSSSSVSQSSRSASPNDLSAVLLKTADTIEEMAASEKSRLAEHAAHQSKVLVAQDEEKVEDYLLGKLHNVALDRLLEEAKISSTEDVRRAWNNCGGLEIVLNVFCTVGKNFDRDYVAAEWTKMGLPQEIIWKLYWYLGKCKKEAIEHIATASSK